MRPPHETRGLPLAEDPQLSPAESAGRASDGRPRAAGRARRWLAFAISVALLLATAARIDLARVAERLAEARPLWVLGALAASVPSILLPARRWVFTASRLGLRVDWGHAWREYYVSVLLNQVLPGGIAGDVVRAVRHRRAVDTAIEDGGALAVKAVVLERASNQLVLWAFLAVALPAWSDAPGAAALRSLGACLAVVAIAAVAWTAIRRWTRGRPLGRTLARVQGDAHRALVADGAFLLHAAVSGAAFVALCVMYACASAAVGVPLDPRTALRVVPLVLGASSVPAVFAGWGLREASAATLYGLVGLSSADGAAASVMYGLVSLLASAPGLWFLATGAARAPERAR